MDPVVASKVQFTKNIADLDKFIPRAHIPKELGGDQEFEYKYIEPAADENKAMQDKEKGDAVMIERMMIGLQLVATTAAWVSAADEAKSKNQEEKEAVEVLKKRRDTVIEEFRTNYWKLDPYVRARALVDRTGALSPDGTVNSF